MGASKFRTRFKEGYGGDENMIIVVGKERDLMGWGSESPNNLPWPKMCIFSNRV